MVAKKKKGMSNTRIMINTGIKPTGTTTTTTRGRPTGTTTTTTKRRRKTVTRKPAVRVTGQALAVTRGKGKKKGLKKRGY